MAILFGSFSSFPHTVDTAEGPKELYFSPLSAKILMQLRGVLRPVLNAFVLFTSSGDSDRQKEFSEASQNGAQQKKSIVTAVTPDIARLRASQKTQAIETLVNELLSEAALKTACLVIADSLRKDVPRGEVEATATKMVDSLSVDEIVSYMAGVAKANKKLVGPFLEKLKSVGAIFSMAASRLAEEIGPQGEQPSEDQPPENPETGSGESSK